MRFTDLIQPVHLTKTGDDPAAFGVVARQQRNAAERFQEIARRKGMSVVRPNARRAAPNASVRVVVGVSTASLPDMELLDDISTRLTDAKRQGIRIQVFNTFHFESLEEYEERIPGIGIVFHTPVVGIWRDGVLTERASGARARDLVRSIFFSSPVMGDGTPKPANASVAV